MKLFVVVVPTKNPISGKRNGSKVHIRVDVALILALIAISRGRKSKIEDHFLYINGGTLYNKSWLIFSIFHLLARFSEKGPL